MRLRKRLPSDQAQVLQLLAAANLPADGLEHTEGWVLEAAGGILGHIALEPVADARVLRSLAVAAEHRGQGFATQLLTAAEAAAAGRVLVLKTDNLGPWLEGRGFARVTLDQVPQSIRTTTQFAGTLCAGTPVYLKESTMNPETIKAAVRERYTGFVNRNTSCCGPKAACGCAGGPGDLSLSLGYAPQDLAAVPEGANLGLGCGNPVALASLQPGEVVLDLGSGAGFDAFLAAQRVGPTGRVIGVDMTEAMLTRARALAEQHHYGNVEFRQGDLEQLPVADASVDAILSNCVINLTTDKARAFREAFRVLKPGGRLMVSDLVLLQPLPEALRQDLDAYAACIAGALPKADYLEAIQGAGFQEVTVVSQSSYDLGTPEGAAAEAWSLATGVVSVQIRADKPIIAETPLSAG